MSFRCCENCIVSMICSEPCEKFEVDKLHLNDLLSFNNCLMLMRKYKNKTYCLKHQVNIALTSEVIYISKNGKYHRDNGPAIIHADGYKVWYQNGKYQQDNEPVMQYTERYKMDRII